MAKGKRTTPKNLLPPKAPQKESDYDLGKSFSKVRQYSRGSYRTRQDQTADTTLENNNFKRRRVESSEEFENRTYTENTWSIYTHLDDKLSSFSDRNEEAHTILRQELEHKVDSVNQKCDKKVSWSVFMWIIGGILAIASVIVVIWWNTSYGEIIKLPREVQSIHNRVNRLEENCQPTSVQDTIKAVNK